MMVDGHLDLAQNALAKGRDLTRPLEEVREQEPGSPEETMVTLPELREAGIGLVFASLFSMPVIAGRPALPMTYHSPAEARLLAVEQLDLYERWEAEGRTRIIRSLRDLDHHVAAWTAGDGRIGMVILMEGCEPLSSPADVGWWFDRGVRIIGPAWRATRYAGGTGAPGPLTADGIELIHEMMRLGAILDVSHLAEISFWQALDLGQPHVMASHSNVRSIVASDRHLSDAMIQAIAGRDGVIGLIIGNSFLTSRFRRGDPKTSVTLADVRLHAEHIARVAGWGTVGIGSDFDGGFGRQGCPAEIERGASFARLGEAAPPEHREEVLGGNWLRFLRHVLPA